MCMCDGKKFIKKQVATRLLISLGIKTPLNPSNSFISSSLVLRV